MGTNTGLGIGIGIPFKNFSSGGRQPLPPDLKASLKGVWIAYGKTNEDSDRSIVKNLVDSDNPFVISNAAYTEGSGYADKDSPYYGAFVTDGIDDLITSTKPVQEMLGGSNEITVVSMIHLVQTPSVSSEKAYTNQIRTGQNYLRNYVTNNDKTGIYGYTYKENNVSVINNILGDKNDYIVENKSWNNLVKFSVIGYEDNGTINELDQVAWYWTIIANKVLTTDQINQVIAYFNLDRTLKPDILCNITKQGITNDNHADFNDKLIDYSGNGRDIQMNNLAWKGGSGIAAKPFETIKDYTILSDEARQELTIYNEFSYKVKSNTPNYYWVVQSIIKDNTSYQVTIITDKDCYWINSTSFTNNKGNKESIRKEYPVKANTPTQVIICGLNEFEYPEGIEPTTAVSYVNLKYAGEITVTFIPSHKGGLLLDGVNDFGKVTGMPVYKDYTIVVDYERISGIEQAWAEALISKAYIANQGAFVLMETNGMAKHSYSFGAYTTFNKDDSTRTLLYQSKYKCGNVDLNAGTGIDGDTLWLGTYRDNYSSFFNGAIYSLMSFPYSMSEFLIERQLKKHKLGTLYPDMVEFRPIVTYDKDLISKLKYFYIPKYVNWVSISPGDYLPNNAEISFTVDLRYPIDEVSSNLVFSNLENVRVVKSSGSGNSYDIRAYVTNKSPQKINITIDEYIRYEDIVQPYPSLFTLIDCDTEEVYSWGSKLKVGARFKGNVVNLLPNMYEWQGDVLYNGEVLNWGINPGVVAKEMVFSWNMPFKYLIDNNEPKCILSPRLLRIPNSSYKLLGYIPDISGHGNHGVIHNSAYAEGSGVNEDGSYQFDGVDDFVTIPTTVGGKQVLMKVNWQKSPTLLYDQRASRGFAILTTKESDVVNSRIAYQGRNQDGKTYIDGIENNNIETYTLKDITHNITIANSSSGSIIVPAIGCNTGTTSGYAQMDLYDFMLFDDISTDDKIKQLNEYVGIEAKVELPPYYWDAYGKTNLDADKATIQQRGVAVGDYDLTNTNFAYDKMSGFGGYTLGKFTDSWSLSNNNNSISIVARNPYDITLKKLGGNSDWEFNNTELKIISNPVSVKFKSDKNIRFTCDYYYYTVGGNSEGAPLGITSKDLIANEDTIITISPISQENIDKYNIDINRGYYLIYFQLSLTLAVNEEVTIEMLPLYPNGLVYDGVSDFTNNKNIPILTDFTFIIKREILGLETNESILVIKGDSVYNNGIGNAFILEHNNNNGVNYVYSYGKLNQIKRDDSKIIYLTPESYNGNPIIKGENGDNLGLKLSRHWKGIIYKTILYSKTISLLQINFLKNLMEKDEIIDLNNPIFIKNE